MRKKLSYEKSAHKILVKLTTGGSMGSGYELQIIRQPLKIEKSEHRFGILGILEKKLCTLDKIQTQSNFS